jgi:hypothetical protein
MLAWHMRQHSFLAGVVIGIASLPKYFAASILIPFLMHRQWPAVWGFLTVWMFALATLLALRADVLTSYMNANQTGMVMQIARFDNGALVVVGWRLAGWIGAILLAGLVTYVVWQALRVKPQTLAAWWCWCWLGVAALPIAWTYSLLPLLPGIIHTLKYSSRTPSRILAGTSLLLPFIAPVPTSSPLVIASFITSAGVAFALASHFQLAAEER